MIFLAFFLLLGCSTGSAYCYYYYVCKFQKNKFESTLGSYLMVILLFYFLFISNVYLSKTFKQLYESELLYTAINLRIALTVMLFFINALFYKNLYK